MPAEPGETPGSRSWDPLWEGTRAPPSQQVQACPPPGSTFRGDSGSWGGTGSPAESRRCRAAGGHWHPWRGARAGNVAPTAPRALSPRGLQRDAEGTPAPTWTPSPRGEAGDPQAAGMSGGLRKDRPFRRESLGTAGTMARGGTARRCQRRKRGRPGGGTGAPAPRQLPQPQARPQGTGITSWAVLSRDRAAVPSSAAGQAAQGALGTRGRGRVRAAPGG